MSVRIIIDSAADMPVAVAAANGFWHAPLKTVLAGKEYRDGVDMTPDVFYDKLQSNKELARTSQINVGEFDALFAKAVAAGEDVVAITLSSGLSGTYQSATLAAANYPGRVFVVDSLSATAGEQLLALEAGRMRDAGMSAAAMADALRALRKRLHLIIRVETLEYLKRGGRVSKSAAFVGNMLHFMPLLTLNQEGKLESVGKARGLRMSHKMMNDMVNAAGGIDFNHPVVLTYAGDLGDAPFAAYARDSAALFAGHEEMMVKQQLGCVIGTHTGPGALTLAFIKKS